MTIGPVSPSDGGGTDPDLLVILESGRAFGGECPSRRIDTHAATIFLTASGSMCPVRYARTG